MKYTKKLFFFLIFNIIIFCQPSMIDEYTQENIDNIDIVANKLKELGKKPRNEYDSNINDVCKYLNQSSTEELNQINEKNPHFLNLFTNDSSYEILKSIILVYLKEIINNKKKISKILSKNEININTDDMDNIDTKCEYRGIKGTFRILARINEDIDEDVDEDVVDVKYINDWLKKFCNYIGINEDDVKRYEDSESFYIKENYPVIKSLKYIVKAYKRGMLHFYFYLYFDYIVVIVAVILSLIFLLYHFVYNIDQVTNVEIIEVRNQCEATIYNGKNTLKEFEGKISDELKAEINSTIEETEKVLASDSKDVEKIRGATENLQMVLSKIYEEMSKKQNQEAPQDQASENNPSQEEKQKEEENK
ncbi:hypothetical protein AB836_00765 [Rickettsiales bacterium (ex Bugula neritina AB1)]|nr:hypothetical protein AB836_00765 [Rickettsiales bacterium (ex Bugula neritina AB1)]